MPHPQNIRRARRASRSRAESGTAALVAVGLIGLAALSTVTPAVAAPSSASQTSAAVAVTGSDALTLSEISDDAQTTLDAARAALARAASVSARVAASDLDLGATGTSIDTGELRDHVDELSSLDVIPALLLSDLTEEVAAEIDLVTARTTVLSDRLDAAQAQKAAEEAAAKAAAEAAAEAAAQAQREAEAAAAAATALATTNTPAGAQAAAQQQSSANYGWGGDQFSCLVSLWNKESGWNYQAYNASSGATGIPQALPGSKMASAGSDWQTNASTQVAWGLQYIASVYGTPCSAWGHSQSVGWY